MVVDELRKEIEKGVSNVEIDWFLRGELPTSSPSHVPTSHHHAEIPTTIRPQVTHSIQNEHNETVGHALSRTRSLPAESPSTAKKKGFFKSIFGKKKDVTPQVPSRSATASPEPYNAAPERTHLNQALHRSRSMSASATSQLDPKLEEFLRYYKAKGLDQLHHDTNPQSSPFSASSTSASASEPSQSKQKPLVSSMSSDSSLVSSLTSSLNAQRTPQKPKKVDVLGRPLPPHPPKAPLPSALAKKSRFKDLPNQSSTTTASTTSKLNFLRRHVTSEASLSRSDSLASQKKTPPSSSSPTLDGSEPVIIPGLENLPQLKRVAFDIPVFFNDPPQQIPSRTPRQGEVEIMKDGTIVIHKLSAAEKKLHAGSGGGLVVGGSGPLKVLSKPLDDDKLTEDEVHDAQKHSIEVAAAAAAAGARAKEAPNDLRRTITNHEDEVSVSTEATKVTIDKPMIRHNKSSASLMTMASENGQDSSEIKVPNDLLYTRCCHLREILAIPATLKQLKPGSCDPISLLQLRNPKPSLVEVLTFSDFISIAPILCVSLDGVSLSSEMFRIILSSLVHKKKLEKLTLRNTPIDETGWKLLCWFLTKNQTLSRLDLTQVPSLVTNVQKPSKAITPNVTRMECDMNSRSDMNWNLLSAALASRNGIDEIVINGAKMSDSEFKNFIELGVSLKTTKLGLAYNDLSEEQCNILSSKLNLKQITGLDLGYNDLSGKLETFNQRLIQEKVVEANLKFISLNSCNLTNENGTVETMISAFSSLRDLRYIDLSNNKKLFPSIIMCLTENLPLYPHLGRIHLDYNDLTQEGIVAFAELIPFCKNLTNISLIGNHLDKVSASALTSAVRLSKSIISIDINYEEISPKFREQIAIYTVRNLQHQVYGKQTDNSELKDLQEEISQLLRTDESTPADEKLISKFLQRAFRIRKRIHETIDELFKLRINGELNTDGKEALIRFCFIDSSIEKGLTLLQQKSPAFQHYLNSSSIPTDSSHDIGSEELATPKLMTRQSSTNLASSSYVNESGHGELLPFGMNDNTDDVDTVHGDAQEIKDDGGARSADDLKLKEEASVLKLGSLFRGSDYSKNITEEGIDSLKDDIGSENFKEILLETSDLNNVVDILDSLKRKGIAISQIYKKGDEHINKSNNNEFLDLETLKNTNSNINRTTKTDEKDTDTEKHLKKNSIIINDSDTSDTDTDIDEDLEGKDDINQAYDEILDHLERVRTNN